MEILKRKIKRPYEGDMEEAQEQNIEITKERGIPYEWIEIQELIKDEEIDKYVYEISGKVIFKHVLIMKMANWVGADFEESKPIQVGNENNNYRDLFNCSCRFPDGSVSHMTGESSYLTIKEHNNIGRGFMAAVAEKRGRDKAFLRSRYIDFPDIYSEEEADDFKEEKKEQDRLAREEERRKQQEKPPVNPNVPKLGELYRYVSLPESDPKYPRERVVEVWMKHKDKEYIEELSKSEDKIIASVAQVSFDRILRLEKEEKERQEKELKEQEKQEETQIEENSVVIEEEKEVENAEVKEVEEKIEEVGDKAGETETVMDDAAKSLFGNVDTQNEENEQPALFADLDQPLPKKEKKAKKEEVTESKKEEETEEFNPDRLIQEMESKK